MGCTRCDNNKLAGRPPCGYHRVGSSMESKVKYPNLNKIRKAVKNRQKKNKPKHQNKYW